MNIMKILKGYFLFVMMVGAMSLLSYNDNVRTYFANVFVAEGTAVTTKTYSVVYTSQALLPKFSLNYVTEKQNSAVVNFEITRDTDWGFGLPGGKKVPVMKLNFKTGDQPLEFDNVKFSIQGVDELLIQGAYLLDENEVVASAKKVGGHLKFSSVDYELAARSEGSVVVALDLSPALKTGQRIRLDIDAPEDFGLRVGGIPYKIGAYYPMKGKYLSIARPRP